MLGSCSSTQSEKLLDETPITIKIPSKISKNLQNKPLKSRFTLDNLKWNPHDAFLLL